MIYQQLGAYELGPELPFIRWINPSDFDIASAHITKILKDDYKGVPIGFDQSKVHEFLRLIIRALQTRMVPLTDETIEMYRNDLAPNYDNEEDLYAYLESYIKGVKAGIIPKNILRPWEYEMIEPHEEVKQELTATMWRAILPLAVAGAAIAFFFSAGSQIDETLKVFKQKS